MAALTANTVAERLPWQAVEGALRSHLAEFGIVAAKGPAHIATLAAKLGEPGEKLPIEARIMLEVLADTIAALDGRIAQLDAEIARRAREDETARRLMTIPGIGPITATAFAALAPPADTFRRGRDFAAWLGLTPLQRSTGGKQRLGRVSKMGERSLRRLLIIGASAVVSQAARRGAQPGTWLARMLATEPRMLIVVALANKMARTVWALMAKGEDYRAPVAAA
jgi:transposase